MVRVSENSASTPIIKRQITLPRAGVWDGVSFVDALHGGYDDGREFLITSQGAWACQRGVRFADHLYLRAQHDGYHWRPDRMLFDIVDDQHEQTNLIDDEPALAGKAEQLLDGWLSEQLDPSLRASTWVTPDHPNRDRRIDDETSGSAPRRWHLRERQQRR